jgi:aminoglycoside 6'-N-acetyltransferase
VNLSFRPIQPDDIPTLHRWRNMPHISQWWDPQNPTLAEVRDEYAAYMRPDYNVNAFILILDGVEIGYIQNWGVAAFPDYKPYVQLDDREMGIDVFIGDPSRLHQGIGTAAIRQFLQVHIFADPTVPACLIDPVPENAAAIRAYEKVGFRHVKTFQHEGKGVYLMRLPRP